MDSTSKGYTTWTNMWLARGDDSQTKNILSDIMEGSRMKVLLEEFTGIYHKGFDNLSKLSASQKVTRADWFVSKLKKVERLDKALKTDSALFALSSPDEVFPVLWQLVQGDMATMWEVAPLFHTRCKREAILSCPLQIGPCKLLHEKYQAVKPFYVDCNGYPLSEHYRRTVSRPCFDLDGPSILTGLINAQLKTTVDGRKLKMKHLTDIPDSKIICALVNSLIPGTFTTEVLLNDRWTIDMALEFVSNVFQVNSSVYCEDLMEGEEEGVCAFITYFLLSGFQFRQAQLVGCRVNELKQKMVDVNDKMKDCDCPMEEAEEMKQQLASLQKELAWLQAVYDTDQCIEWMVHGEQVQAEVRAKIAVKMEERFDVVSVTSHMTINKLTESMGINLSITGGNGFYKPNRKEKLWTERKIVARDVKSGEFLEDFSGRPNIKGSVRQALKLHAYEVVEVEPDRYGDYEIFLESTSRNKVLKAGTKFLYQVFPGTRRQCERLLHRAAREGEITAIEKLVVFFKSSKEFVDCREKESGNTALHFASRHGHYNVARFLLESGANVNLQNLPGCTPFFLATEHIHKNVSQLLLEWGADISVKNHNSKVALEVTRNADLRDYLQGKYEEYQELSAEVRKQNVAFVEKTLENHVLKRNRMEDIKCRCVGGNTLFHIAASLGSKYGLEVFYNEHVDPNLMNADGTAPLHVATDPVILQSLLDHEADINACDHAGNMPLHVACGRQSVTDHMLDIRLLVKHHALLDAANHQNWLPIHCAVASGNLPVVQLLLELDVGGALTFLKDKDKQDDDPGTLLSLAVARNHMDIAVWLSSMNFQMKSEEADKLMSQILHGEMAKCGNPINTVVFLLKHGATPNSVYSKNIRPLHLTASLVDFPELTSILVEAGAKVDPLNNLRATPLFNACKSSNLFAAKFLLEKGANHHLKDVHGKCAFDYIQDHQEWIDSGLFTDDTRALLKAFSLRHAREMVRSIANSLRQANQTGKKA